MSEINPIISELAVREQPVDRLEITQNSGELQKPNTADNTARVQTEGKMKVHTVPQTITQKGNETSKEFIFNPQKVLEELKVVDTPEDTRKLREVLINQAA